MARGAERGSAEERITPRRGEQSPPPGPGQMLPPARASGPHAPGPEWPRGVGGGAQLCRPCSPHLLPSRPRTWSPHVVGTQGPKASAAPSASLLASKDVTRPRDSSRAHGPGPWGHSATESHAARATCVGSEGLLAAALSPLCPVQGRRPPPGRLVSRRADGAAQSVRKRECGGGQTGSRTWRGRSCVGRGGPATPVCCSLPLGHHSSLVTPLGAGSPRALPRGPCLALLSPPFSKRGGTLARASWPGRPLPPEVQAQGPSDDAGDTRSPRAPASGPAQGPPQAQATLDFLQAPEVPPHPQPPAGTGSPLPAQVPTSRPGSLASCHLQGLRSWAGAGGPDADRWSSNSPRVNVQGQQCDPRGQACCHPSLDEGGGAVSKERGPPWAGPAHTRLLCAGSSARTSPPAR